MHKLNLRKVCKTLRFTKALIIRNTHIQIIFASPMLTFTHRMYKQNSGKSRYEYWVAWCLYKRWSHPPSLVQKWRISWRIWPLKWGRSRFVISFEMTTLFRLPFNGTRRELFSNIFYIFSKVFRLNVECSHSIVSPISFVSYERPPTRWRTYMRYAWHTMDNASWSIWQAHLKELMLT